MLLVGAVAPVYVSVWNTKRNVPMLSHCDKGEGGSCQHCADRCIMWVLYDSIENIGYINKSFSSL